MVGASPGSLQLEDSHFLTAPPPVSDEVRQQLEARDKTARTRRSHDIMTEATTPHIASPDIHIDDERQKIVMYFHGLEDAGRQVTQVALWLGALVPKPGVNLNRFHGVTVRYQWNGWPIRLDIRNRGVNCN